MDVVFVNKLFNIWMNDQASQHKTPKEVWRHCVETDRRLIEANLHCRRVYGLPFRRFNKKTAVSVNKGEES